MTAPEPAPLTDRQLALADTFFAAADASSPRAKAKRLAWFRAFGLIEAVASTNLDGGTIVIESGKPVHP